MKKKASTDILKPITVNVYDTTGAVVEKRELPADIFGVPVKDGLLHLAVVAQQANSRTVIASTKRRGEVRGGGRKPWKQKGTGRARHGSIRSPIWRGGGVVFGPRTERNYSLKINAKAKKKAIAMALSQKVATERLILVSSLEMAEPKTKNAVGILSKFDMLKKAKAHSIGLVSPKGAKAVVKSFRNVASIKLVPANSLNVVDILACRYLVMPVQSVEEISSQFSKKSATPAKS